MLGLLVCCEVQVVFVSLPDAEEGSAIRSSLRGQAVVVFSDKQLRVLEAHRLLALFVAGEVLEVVDPGLGFAWSLLEFVMTM